MSSRQKPSTLSACICTCHDTLLPTTLTSFGQVISQSAGCSLSNVDEELTRCQARMRVLRRLRNSLLPVSRLPPEILCKVFGYISLGLATYLRDAEPAEWLQFSQVCQHWRETALGCSALWTHPPLLHPILTEELMERSQQLPIHIRTNPAYFDKDNHPPCHPRGLISALLHLHRIQTLEIAASPNVVQDLIVPALYHHAPLLESFKISTAHHALLDLSLFPDLFLGAAPRLRRLSLDRIAMAWSAPVFRMITHLRVSNDPGASSMSWHMFFDGLEGLSHLIALDLHYALPEDDASSISGRQFHLPRLRKLRIADMHPDMDVFLAHIPWKAYPGLHLYAICEGGVIIGPDTSWAVPVLSQFLRDSSCEAPHQVLIGGTCHFSSADRPIDHPRLHLSLPQHPDTLEICQLIPLWFGWSDSIGSLSVSADLDFFPKSSWHAIFAMLQNTHTIHVSGTAVTSFLCALEEDPQLEENGLGPSLQALRRVYIHKTSLPQHSTQTTLRRVFSKRHGLQLPLVELHHWGSLGNMTSVPGVEKVVRDLGDHNQYLEIYDWSDDEL